MSNRAKREAVLQREREALARGSLSEEEQVRFDQDRAWEMHQAEKRRQGSTCEPELPLGKAA